MTPLCLHLCPQKPPAETAGPQLRVAFLRVSQPWSPGLPSPARSARSPPPPQRHPFLLLLCALRTMDQVWGSTEEVPPPPCGRASLRSPGFPHELPGSPLASLSLPAPRPAPAGSAALRHRPRGSALR